MGILVTGGAGYIGSTTVELLRQAGESVVVLDNLRYGHRAAVDDSVPFYDGDIGDQELVKQIVAEHAIDACVHFAAFAYVGESVEKPDIYYENNVQKGISLLTALKDAGVRHLVFSSTCATYGEPVRMPIDESHPQSPLNPYGWSKFMMERILDGFDVAYDFRSVALRYFNASGAIETRGEDHSPETHLIPIVLEVALGQRDSIKIFGDDYDTPDGTAVRDYIHVADLGQAHILALQYLRRGGESNVFNLGNGNGYSVKEVIDNARDITGHAIPAETVARRAGDATRLIADASKAHDILGWEPRYPELDAIIRTAWAWHQSHPDGYDD